MGGGGTEGTTGRTIDRPKVEWQKWHTVCVGLIEWLGVGVGGVGFWRASVTVVYIIDNNINDAQYKCHWPKLHPALYALSWCARACGRQMGGEHGLRGMGANWGRMSPSAERYPTVKPVTLNSRTNSRG